ncbi:hypothetical protein [Rathayibacter sp. VKM Ac-2630]|nr:hypothetical protein [Rathayibacter sp. VKM Ac-2630]
MDRATRVASSVMTPTTVPVRRARAIQRLEWVRSRIMAGAVLG